MYRGIYNVYMLIVVCIYVLLPYVCIWLICVWGKSSIHQRGDNKTAYDMTYITIIVTMGRIA